MIRVCLVCVRLGTQIEPIGQPILSGFVWFFGKAFICRSATTTTPFLCCGQPAEKKIINS